MKIVRAEKLYEQAGAYHVRIESMAREHHIDPDDEFDEHDTPETKYIVIMDDVYPVATCRLYEIDEASVMMGRIVVHRDYRGRGLGKLALFEAEKWAKELGYTTSVLESREEVVGFYEKAGYEADLQRRIHGVTFDCIHMEKNL